ncbi:MAG: insulinase family protein [Deltaproteobacteria bacterium]|jgi:hypothetical protein|nr:insulinase family protein [Deltaproteobacteria bacterium]
MIPLLWWLVAAPQCQALAGGGELCAVETGVVPWVEVAVGFKIPADPPGKAGLALAGQAAAAINLPRLPPGWTLGLSEAGLVLQGGLHPANLETELEPLLTAFVRRFDRPAAELAVARAVELRRQLLDQDPTLARFELERALYGGRPTGVDRYGQAAELVAVSADELLAWQRRVICKQNLHLVVAGPVPNEVQVRLTSLSRDLPECAAATKTPSMGPPPPTLDLMVIDKPERSVATLAIGARLGLGPSPAAWAVAAACLSGRAGLLGASVDGAPIRAEVLGPPNAPSLLILAKTPTPAALLSTLLPALSRPPKLDAAAIQRARTLAASDAAAALRDPSHLARTVLNARLWGRPAEEPGELSAAILALEDPAIEAAVRALMVPPKALVVVTSAEARRVQELGRTPGVRRTVVVGYDTR